VEIEYENEVTWWHEDEQRSTVKPAAIRYRLYPRRGRRAREYVSGIRHGITNHRHGTQPPPRTNHIRQLDFFARVIIKKLKTFSI